MPLADQPPRASDISDGHSTALKRSLKLCLNEWMTDWLPICVCSHLFNALLAELAFVRSSIQYLLNAYAPSAVSQMRCAAHKLAPIRETCLALLMVFKRRQGCGLISTYGIVQCRLMSETSSPAASDISSQYRLLKQSTNAGHRQTYGTTFVCVQYLYLQ